VRGLWENRFVRGLALVAIVSLAILLPVVGWLFALLVVMLGTGALFLERRAGVAIA